MSSHRRAIHHINHVLTYEYHQMIKAWSSRLSHMAIDPQILCRRPRLLLAGAPLKCKALRHHSSKWKRLCLSVHTQRDKKTIPAAGRL